jgi:hypothetical protein
MRTVLFLVAGFLLLGGFVLLGRLFAAQYPDALRITVVAYVVVWLVVAGANMWLGVAKAGYSLGEELPIFFLIFAVPAVVAVVLKWKFI